MSLAVFVCSCSNKQETEEAKPVETVVDSETILPYYGDATFQPHWFTNEDSLKEFHKIRPFNLLDQKGEAFTEQDVVGKIYVADFFFATCGGICPKMTSNMKVIQDAFIDDPEVILLSHSVTPTNDTPEVLGEYGDRNGVIYENWKLLTGERKEMYDLARNYYFVEESLGLEKSEDDFLHTENFVLVDQNRNIRGIVSCHLLDNQN